MGRFELADGGTIFLDDDEDATLSLFLRTRSANAFNWVALGHVGDAGTNVHTIEVKAALTVNVNESGAAAAAVGKRTLTVIPGKLANDAQF